MEVHRQTCQACGSIEVRNILAREPEIRTVIYVRCANCGALVARYVLREYYHHGKGVDSYLRSAGSDVRESGRQVLSEFERVREEAVAGFEKVLTALSEEGKAV